MAEETTVGTDNVGIDTGWKNPPTLADLKQNYDDAKLEHDVQQAKIDTWVENLHITGKAKLTPVKGRSNVQPKVIRKQAEWRYPALTEPFLSTDDLYNINPVTAKDVKAAAQNQLVLNHQFNTKLGKVKFIDDFVRAAVDEGTVIVRTGWETEEEIIEEEVPVYEFIPDVTGQVAQQYMALAQLKQVNPDQYAQYVNPGVEKAMEMFFTTGATVIAEQTGVTIEERTIETKNQPTVLVCSSRNVIIDPSCNGDTDKANFVIFDFETSKSALEKTGIYKNLDKINVNAASPLNQPDFETSKDNSNFNFKDEPRTKFIASEYWGSWDIDGSGIVQPIVATWVNGTLIRMEKSPFPDKKLPFEFVSLMPVRGSVYGEPDGELLLDNQLIIGAVTRGMIDLMGKSAAGQTGMRKDFLDTSNSMKYKKGLDYEYNGSVDPRLGVFQHTYPEIPQSAYNMLTLQNGEAESFTGVKSYNAGISAQALGDVAAGIRGALDAASKRELGILRRLAEGIIRIGRKIISMNAVFLSDEEVIRITDEEFVTVKRDDLAGNFDLKLSISTAEEDNQKAQELAFMLQTTGNNMDPVLSRMILADIARLRKMPALAKRIEEFEPQPDPMAVKKAELELQLLAAQIANEQAQAAAHNATAGLKGAAIPTEQVNTQLTAAKIGTEQAKARQLASDADNKDLDYVEQESGVKQERDLQKIGRQAESQAKTKIIEAMVKPAPAKAAAK